MRAEAHALPAVLIVEDDPDLRKLTRAIIRDVAGDIDEAADGEQAVEMIGRRAYDVVILDLMLPRRNGFEVYEVIRKLPDPPGVVVTSAIALYYCDRFDAGVALIQKPFTNEDLSAAVRAAAV